MPPLKEAKFLEGKTLSLQIQENIKRDIDAFVSKGLERPQLHVIQVAHESATDWYISQQKKLAEKLTITFNRPQFFDRDEPQRFGGEQKHLIELIKRANTDPRIHGIFLAMPLPLNFSADEALLALDPKKDVEGIHPINLGLIVLRKTKLIPTTAFAAFRLIESTGISLRGKRAVVIGQSAIVGRPIQMLLGEQRVTTTVCNTGTSPQDLQKIVSESNIVVACSGQPGLVKGSWIQPGAVVIDVGTTEVNGKLAGDVEFEEAKARAAFITPVPGGVGPLTVTMLMQNLITAYQWQRGL